MGSVVLIALVIDLGILIQHASVVSIQLIVCRNHVIRHSFQDININGEGVAVGGHSVVRFT